MCITQILCQIEHAFIYLCNLHLLTKRADRREIPYAMHVEKKNLDEEARLPVSQKLDKLLHAVKSIYRDIIHMK